MISYLRYPLDIRLIIEEKLKIVSNLYNTNIILLWNMKYRKEIPVWTLWAGIASDLGQVLNPIEGKGGTPELNFLVEGTRTL